MTEFEQETFTGTVGTEDDRGAASANVETEAVEQGAAADHETNTHCSQRQPWIAAWIH